MSTGLSTYTDATSISASALRTTFRGVEAWLNETSVQADLQSSPAWVDTQHIFGPAAFGGSSPRWEGPSCEIVHDETDFTTYTRTIYHESAGTGVYVPVPGLCRRIRVMESSLWVQVACSFYAYHLNASPFADTDETTLAATFQLQDNRAAVTATDRRIYRNYGNVLARKQIGIVADLTLATGVHDIGVYVRLEALSETDAMVWIEPRGIAIDLDYR